MSLRFARLFTATLIGLSATATVLAAGPQLVWRGDITTARGVVTDVAKAWEKAGEGKIELQPFNTASGIDAVAKGSADLAGSARPGIGGAEKSLILKDVLDKKDETSPARLIAPVQGRLVWLVDRPAASQVDVSYASNPPMALRRIANQLRIDSIRATAN